MKFCYFGTKNIFVIKAANFPLKGQTGYVIVKLSMQCSGQILQDLFEKYKTFPRCIITKFECTVDVKNHEFGWVRFQNRFFKTIK